MEIRNAKLRESPTFLRYNEILRYNPSSIVFAPLAEILIVHKCYEDAIQVCLKGLSKNPDVVIGRLALARAYIGISNYKKALEQAKLILDVYSDHKQADEIRKVCERYTLQTEDKRPKTDSDHRPKTEDQRPETIDHRPKIEDKSSEKSLRITHDAPRMTITDQRPEDRDERRGMTEDGCCMSDDARRTTIAEDLKYSRANEIISKYSKILEDSAKTINVIATRQEKVDEKNIVDEKIAKDMPVKNHWNTMTMAKIFEMQGKNSKALEIYKNILKKDPNNENAKQSIARLDQKQLATSN